MEGDDNDNDLGKIFQDDIEYKPLNIKAKCWARPEWMKHDEEVSQNKNISCWDLIIIYILDSLTSKVAHGQWYLHYSCKQDPNYIITGLVLTVLHQGIQ